MECLHYPKKWLNVIFEEDAKRIVFLFYFFTTNELNFINQTHFYRNVNVITMLLSENRPKKQSIENPFGRLK